MYLQIIILALILVTNRVNANSLTCKLERDDTELECVLSTKFDKFDVSSQVTKWKLDQVQRVRLFVGTTESPYEPPTNSSRIVYPDWDLMKQVNQLSIQFNLKLGQEELHLNLDEFQYISKDSFIGVNLKEIQMWSNNPEVIIEVNMLSSLSQLDKLWVEGASINAQEGWGNLAMISNLKLAGVQIGSMDLGWLPLKTLTSLDLSLKEIQGVNITIAEEMDQLMELSLTVLKTQTPDWSFINKLVERLHSLKLDGFALGNIGMDSISENSAVQYLTLSHSPNTKFIGQYSFNSANYIAIELSGMNTLSYIEEFAFSGASSLINLTITDMAILTQLTQSLGSDATPKSVQFTNNPQLSEISLYIFQEITKYSRNLLESVDVRRTEMDSKCPCEASYLAAMSKKWHIQILSDCLDKWLKGMCKQDNCWTFVKRCNHTCQEKSDPFSYTCTCKSEDKRLALLPDGYTCGSSKSCKLIRRNDYYCSQYDAMCKRDEEYECRCTSYKLWDQAKELCVSDRIVPLYTTVHTQNTLIPLVTNSTVITLIPLVTNTTITALPIVSNTTTITALPIVTNSTTKPWIPIVTNSTTKPWIPIVTNSTTKPWIPIVTNSTTISAHTLGPLVTNVTGKTFHSPTHFVSGKTIIPGTGIITDVTLEPSVTNNTVTQISISTNKTTKTVTTVSIRPTLEPQGLGTEEKVYIGIALLIPILVIVCVVLLTAFCCYRRKKGARHYARGLRDSPGLLDIDT